MTFFNGGLYLTMMDVLRVGRLKDLSRGMYITGVCFKCVTSYSEINLWMCVCTRCLITSHLVLTIVLFISLSVYPPQAVHVMKLGSQMQHLSVWYCHWNAKLSILPQQNCGSCL